jgi:hypothetical protein
MRFPRNFAYIAMKTAINAANNTAAKMNPIPVPMLTSVGTGEVRRRIERHCVV